jgi:flagellar biogenesis protein FliO
MNFVLGIIVGALAVVLIARWALNKFQGPLF